MTDEPKNPWPKWLTIVACSIAGTALLAFVVVIRRMGEIETDLRNTQTEIKVLQSDSAKTERFKEAQLGINGSVKTLLELLSKGKQP